MALFRKKTKEPPLEEDQEPAGDAYEQMLRMSFEELLALPEVQAQQRDVEEGLVKRADRIKLHLEVVHEPGGLERVKSEADFMEFGAMRPYLDALSDITFAVEEQLVTGTDVYTIWTVTGTHTGELCGVPPSGAPVTIRGITMSVVREGVVATEYTYWDFPPATERIMSAAPA